MDLQKLILFYSIFLAVFSLFFWAWAAVNTVNMGNVDLGVISFALAFAAGIVGILAPPVAFMVASPVASVIVAANYVLGAILVDETSFVVYCIAFALLWIAMGAGSAFLAFKARIEDKAVAMTFAS